MEPRVNATDECSRLDNQLGLSSCCREHYCSGAVIASTAAFRSSSLQLPQVPFGGMAPLPASTVAVMASTPVAMRGAQAALSSILGAPPQPCLMTGDTVFLHHFIGT